MDIANQLIYSFCQLDDFCKEFDHYVQYYLLDGPNVVKRGSQLELPTQRSNDGSDLFLVNVYKWIPQKLLLASINLRR